MGHYGIQKKSPDGRGSTKRALNSELIPTMKDATPVKLEEPKSADACTRCGGLLVSHWCMNVNYDAGGMEILTKRCLQCGEVIDPVILENRQHPEREAMKKKTRPLLSRPLASSKSKSAGLSCSPVA